MELIKDKSSLYKVLAFITCEVLAIISFQLSQSFLFLALVGIILTIILSIFCFKKIKGESLYSYITFLFPLIIYGFLSLASSFTKDPSLSFASWMIYLIPIVLLCFSFIGYYISSNISFKIRTALLIIYSAIALLTLINLVFTLVQFKPFYTLMYDDYYLYYEGAKCETPISEMAFYLFGFSFEEVSLAYFSLLPTLLLTAFTPLFFLSFKENKKEFLLFLCYGLFGVITLILTLNVLSIITTILSLIVIVFLVLAIKFKIKPKTLKIIGIIFGIILAILFLIFFLNAQTDYWLASLASPLINLIDSNTLLSRLFVENRISMSINLILDKMFLFNDSFSKFFGIFAYPLYGYFPGDSFSRYANTSICEPMGSWFFDSFMTSGFLGTIAITVFIIFIIKQVIKYIRLNKEETSYKALLGGFIFVFIVYSFLALDASPLVLKGGYYPIYTNSYFYIVLFLASYCCYKNFHSEKKIDENKETINNFKDSEVSHE